MTALSFRSKNHYSKQIFPYTKNKGCRDATALFLFCYAIYNYIIRPCCSWELPW